MWEQLFPHGRLAGDASLSKLEEVKGPVFYDEFGFPETMFQLDPLLLRCVFCGV
jgi:hypothetical protein